MQVYSLVIDIIKLNTSFNSSQATNQLWKQLLGVRERERKPLSWILVARMKVLIP